MQLEDAFIDSSEALNQRFLMLIQAVSGIRGLTALETDELGEAELLDRVLGVLIQNLDLDRCSIFLLDEDRLHCVAGKDWDEYIHKTDNRLKRRNSHTFRIGEGIIGVTAKTGRLYHCKNCRVDNKYLPVIHSDIDKNVGSLICTPIMFGKELIGVLNISHPEPNFFHTWQEHVVAIHANILGQMLHNHRLLSNIRQEVTQRTKDLEDALWTSENIKSQYETLSLVDDLTQLHNRRYFFSEAPRMLSHCMRYSEPFSLLLLDLDNFKEINDTHGHDAGDRVLTDIGHILKQQTRAGDVVARLGGEEFVFALPNTGINGARKFAERIRKKVEELTWFLDETSFAVTISIGITEAEDRIESADVTIKTLLKESDLALYECKDLGRNQVTVFAEMNKR